MAWTGSRHSRVCRCSSSAAVRQDSVLLALARLAGVGPIVVVEPDAARRNAALAGGADLVLDPADEAWQERHAA